MARKSWPRRGAPLLRPDVSTQPDPAGTQSTMSALVRHCLLEPPQPASTAWRSPSADRDAELIAADLTRLQHIMAAGVDGS